MGFEPREIKIVARVSRHNSPKDKLDDAYWELVVAMVNMILNEVDFSPIEIEIH